MYEGAFYWIGCFSIILYIYILIFQTTLFNKGSDKLNNEFKTILDKNNKPLLPVDLLNSINNDEGKL